MMRRRAVWLAVLLTFLAGCNGDWSSGDRVLVNKYLYDSGTGRPHRFDVVVFRCPEPPQRGGPLDNFIKRLLGLGAETIAIFFGHLFVTTDWQPPGDLDAQHAEDDPAKAEPLDLWQPKYMYRNDGKARDLFMYGAFTPRGRRDVKRGQFEIIRKGPDVMMALRRIVYDNDHPAKDLEAVHFPARWAASEGSSWGALDDRGFQTDSGQGKDTAWLGYRHILRPLDWPAARGEGAVMDRGFEQGVIDQIVKRKHQPQLITDFSGYNSYEKNQQPREVGGNWVGDLMLDFELTVDRAEGEFWLELARGVDRFQACWELSSGRCTLWRLQDGKQPEKLKSAATAVNAAGTYRLRFANFDERLTVWVDRALPFGDGAAYPRAWHFDNKLSAWVNVGPTANDLKPASLGSKGAAVKVRHLQLWRNTYYTLGGPSNTTFDASFPLLENIPERLRDPISPEDRQERAALVANHWAKFWADPEQWAPLRRLDFATMYVQKGHYLCMGDNSPESHDSRAWGTVPERLMLGRALIVYYPFSRAGLIR
jgi:signal peptidase I